VDIKGSAHLEYY